MSQEYYFWAVGNPFLILYICMAGIPLCKQLSEVHADIVAAWAVWAIGASTEAARRSYRMLCEPPCMLGPHCNVQ